jgi:hypothetical protein
MSRLEIHLLLREAGPKAFVNGFAGSDVRTL